MQLRLLARILPGVATASVISALAVATASNQPSYAEEKKFSCEQEGGVPVTKVRTSRGNETFIRWVVDDFKKFPPKKRCETVTTRFERYYDNGSLYITSRDNFNGYPVLCIANSKGVPCEKENVLVTLKPGTNVGRVLQQIIDFRRGVGGKPINLSGCNSTDERGDLYIDVKQLVDGYCSR